MSMIRKLPTNNSRAQRIGTLTASLARLDIELDNRKRQRTAATIVFIAGLLLAPFIIGIPVILFALFNYFRHKSAIGEMQQRRIGMAAEQARLQAGG